MSVNNFISAIEEYLDLKETLKQGNAEDSYTIEIQEAKKRVALALHDIIDFRLDGIIEERKKRADTTSKRITVPDPDMEWADVISIVEALNSVPSPPANIDKFIKEENIKEWMSQYKRWYVIKRFNALNNKTK